MKYLALIHSDESVWESLSEQERAGAYAGYAAFGEEARAAGVMLAGDELAPTATATTVRIRDGQQLVTDGPYSEVKEALGGFYVLECDSVEDAIDWAARIPAAQYGAVEVRQVHEDPSETPAAEATREEVAS